MSEQPPIATTAEAGTFHVDFQSLIKLLGENLYSNPKAAVRELIQNASDSCVRRYSDDGSQSEIHITTKRDERILIFEDNGAGMAQNEVVQYLASIGGGRTRLERARLSTEDPKIAQMLIGQFGVGFLSSFVIGERVVVDTLSVDGGLPVRWECEGNAEYQISKSDRAEPGTQVTLHLKGAHFDLLEEETLRSVIVRYADFIAFPIYLNGNPNPVNRMNAPWHLQDTESEYAAYIKHRFGVVPLALEPIAVETDGLSAQGVLFIPPRSSDWKHRLRSIDIFQKRMFVGEDFNIMPEWANFVTGVIDCPTLDLVASRESVISERPSYRALQDYLGRAVTTFIQRLAERERPVFLEIIRQHDWAVKLGATRNDIFFDAVKDLIPIPSDLGPLPIPKYLERVPERLGKFKTIYYVPSEQTLGQQQNTLFRSRGVPVFHADLVDEQFLKKYVEKSEIISLRQMNSGVVELMELVEGSRWRTLEVHYQDIGIVARAVRFYPSEMVAMVVRQADYDKERLIEQIMDGSRSLVDFMSRVGRETSDEYGLCFNVDNPIIQRLATYDGDPAILHTVLRAIYSSALLAAGVELNAELSQAVAHSEMRVIELLLDQAMRLSIKDQVAIHNISESNEPNEETGAELEKSDSNLSTGLLKNSNREEGLIGSTQVLREPNKGAFKGQSFLNRLIRRLRK